MSTLTATERTSIRYFLGYSETSVIGSSPLESAMDSVSATAETRIRLLITRLDAVETAMQTGISQAGLKRVEDVEFYQGGQSDDQGHQGRLLCSALGSLLGVPVHNTPFESAPRTGRILRG
jgi:hypothetical protein